MSHPCRAHPRISGAVAIKPRLRKRVPKVSKLAIGDNDHHPAATFIGRTPSHRVVWRGWTDHIEGRPDERKTPRGVNPVDPMVKALFFRVGSSMTADAILRKLDTRIITTFSRVRKRRNTDVWVGVWLTVEKVVAARHCLFDEPLCGIKLNNG